jgi:hypothetical protein
MRAEELPPPVQMTQLLAGFQLSQALYAAAVTEPACRVGACHGGVAQDLMARFVAYMSLTP